MGKKMNQTIGYAVLASALACSLTTSAFAQTEGERGYGYLRRHVRAPAHAFEIGVDAGYMQGFGNLRAGNTVASVAGPGATAGLSLGYRATPLLYVGWTGRLQEFSRGTTEAPGTSIHG